MKELHLAISATTLILVVVFLLQLNDVHTKEQQLNNAVNAAIKTMEI